MFNRFVALLGAVLLAAATLVSTSAPVQAAFAKSPPTGLHQIDKTGTTINVGWNAQTGATKYWVRTIPVSGNNSHSAVGAKTVLSSDTTKKQITGLKPNTWHHIQVRSARGSTLLSDYSTGVWILTPSYSLDPPASLRADYRLRDRIGVSWKVVPNAQSYEVRVAPVGGVTRTLSMSDTSTMDRISYEISGLAPGADHRISVRAMEQKTDANGHLIALTDWREISAETVADSAGVRVDQLPPKSVEVTRVSNSQVWLDWSEVSGATGYRIQWWVGTTKQNERYLSLATGELGGDGSSFNFVERLGEDNAQGVAIEVGQKLNFRVSALDGPVADTRISDYSDDIASVDVPRYEQLAAANLRATSVVPGTVALAWDRVPEAATYRVYWSTNSTMNGSCQPDLDCVITPAQADPGAPQHSVSGLPSGKTYYFKVSALDAAGITISDYQLKPLKVEVPRFGIDAPSPVTQEYYPNETAVKMGWPAVSGVTSYEVLWSSDSLFGFGNEYRTVATNGITITGLKGNTLYYVKVRGLNSSGSPVTDWSVVANGKTRTAQGAITGSVGANISGAAQGTYVFAYDTGGDQVGGARVDSGGKYTIFNLAPGDYRVQFLQLGGHNVTSPWLKPGDADGVMYRSQAPTVKVLAWSDRGDGEPVQTTTAPLGKKVSGKILGTKCLAQTRVTALSDRVGVSKDEVMGDVSTAAGGTYTIVGLPKSEPFWIRFSGSSESCGTRSEHVSATATDSSGVNATFGTSEPIPDTVQGLVASSVSTDSFTLSWNRVPTAAEYRIYYSRSSSMPSACEPNCKKVTPADKDAPSYRLTGLVPGAKYYIKVSAVGTSGKAITGWQPAPLVVDLTGSVATIPDSVQGLKATDVTSSDAVISWDRVPTAARYRIYWSTSSSMSGACEPTCEVVTPTSLSEPSVSLQKVAGSLLQGQVYYVKVSAINAGGKTITGWQSKPLRADLTGDPVTIPDTVQGLASTDEAPTAATISWQQVPTATRYRIYWSKTSSMPGHCEPTCQVVTVSDPTSPTHRLVDLTPDPSYYVKISAINAEGETITSWQSTPLEVTLVATGLASSNVQSTSATITWDPVPGATNYRIYWSTTTPMPGSCEPTCKIVAVDKTAAPSYTLTGLQPGVQLYVKVSSINSVGRTITGWQESPLSVDLVG